MENLKLKKEIIGNNNIPKMNTNNEKYYQKEKLKFSINKKIKFECIPNDI